MILLDPFGVTKREQPEVSSLSLRLGEGEFNPRFSPLPPRVDFWPWDANIRLCHPIGRLFAGDFGELILSQEDFRSFLPSEPSEPHPLSFFAILPFCPGREPYLVGLGTTLLCFILFYFYFHAYLFIYFYFGLWFIVDISISIFIFIFFFILFSSSSFHFA